MKKIATLAILFFVIMSTSSSCFGISLTNNNEEKDNLNIITSTIPNDPAYSSEQWYLDKININQAWDYLGSYGRDDVTVAVLDSGIDYTHPELCSIPDSKIIEEDYYFETEHPISEGDIFYLDGFSNQYEKVSIHFSKIKLNVENGFPDCNVCVYDDNKNPGNMNCFTRANYRIEDREINDVWTSYTEISPLRKTKIRIEITEAGFPDDDRHEDIWGFIIDKVRYLDINDPSEVSDKIVKPYDFVYNDKNPDDIYGHGTFCSGIIGAKTDNNLGMAGIAANCKIMPLEVIGDTFEINPDKLINMIPNLIIFLAASSNRVSDGIRYAVDNGADIISMSLGGQYSLKVKSAIEYAESKGVLIIAAAGNSNTSENSLLDYYCRHKNVFAVAATNQNDERATFGPQPDAKSNFGTWVDIAAPGFEIFSISPTYNCVYNDYGKIVENYGVASGTSAACPIVAGVAALVVSHAKNIGLDLKPVELRTILRSSIDPINTDKYIGIGRINALNALEKTAVAAVELDSSLDDKGFKNNIKIKGVLYADNFEEYRVQYSDLMYPSEEDWITIKNSDSLPSDDILAEWDTSDLEKSNYSIRVRLKANGKYYQDRTYVMFNKEKTRSLEYDTPVWQSFSIFTEFLNRLFKYHHFLILN